MKFNKYWFGKQFWRRMGGFFIPLSWEGWVITAIEIAYLISLSIFQDFYFDYYGIPFAVSALILIISYYLIGIKKQQPKDKGKVWL
ncbi:MAG: hypothetical protein Q7K45_04620 [Nanoarchaeota archaeon]|nr:hypothetical protein [Nanoarchaeota archaeon]